MKALKYNYYRVIQCNYGHGWDDVDFYDVNSQNRFKDRTTYKAFKENYKAYKDNDHGQKGTRAIFRKEKV